MLLFHIMTSLYTKPKMDLESIKRYQPISNLTFVSKVIEKAVVPQQLW